MVFDSVRSNRVFLVIPLEVLATSTIVYQQEFPNTRTYGQFADILSCAPCHLVKSCNPETCQHKPFYLVCWSLSSTNFQNRKLSTDPYISTNWHPEKSLAGIWLHKVVFFLSKKDRFLILKICIILVEVWHIQIYEKITLFLSSVNTFSKIMVPVASFISFFNTKSPIHCVIYTPVRVKKEIL